MIALPGLALVTGRTGVAGEILTTFARHIRDGLLPNRFPDAGAEPAYNTVDAALWFVLTVNEYLAESGDAQLVCDRLWPGCVAVIEAYMRGTRHGIRMDRDGLIAAGSGAEQLTWMDAKVGDWVVTPRHGKPVEINALWVNALRAMATMAESTGLDAARFRAPAATAAAAFARAFWNEEAGCLYDVLTDAGPDASIRPNQLFALALPHALLDRDRAGSVLAVVERDLLTPVGLRSLSPRDPRYRGVYAGSVGERDGAYHQGTVWAWLLGAYVSALLNVRGRDPATLRRARQALRGLEAHLTGAAALNQVSEIFDGDAPHCARGCIAQAWSVAELLRVKRRLGDL